LVLCCLQALAKLSPLQQAVLLTLGVGPPPPQAPPDAHAGGGTCTAAPHGSCTTPHHAARLSTGNVPVDVVGSAMVPPSPQVIAAHHGQGEGAVYTR
jgi:hypothetical protein